VYYLEVGTHDDADFDTYSKELLHRVDGAVRFRRARRAEMPRAQLLLRSLSQEEGVYQAQVDSGVFRPTAALSAAAYGFADSAMSYLRVGDTSAAARYLDRADNIIAQLPSKFADAPPLLLNEICWAGALLGRAHAMLPYCESAAARAKSAYIVDSRGLARALTGNFTGAIEDFEVYIADSSTGSSTKRDRALRREWIAQLRANNALEVARVREQVFPPPAAR
jgi:hypothetical protein